MINKTELMLGNYIAYSESNNIFRVTEISEFGAGVEDENENTWIEYDQFEPIPLTEDILIRCGFNKIPMVYNKHQLKDYMYELGDVEIVIGSDYTNKFVLDWYSDDYGVFCNTKDVKYLHTLQNLVKLLCNQTIELK